MMRAGASAAAHHIVACAAADKAMGALDRVVGRVIVHHVQVALHHVAVGVALHNILISDDLRGRVSAHGALYSG